MIIAGGTGFLGQLLSQFFTAKNYKVKILTRRPSDANHIFWDGQQIGDWVNTLEGAEVLINLSGKSVNCRYHDRNKKQLLESRLQSTAALGKAIQQISSPPKIWINSSSATIYTHAETQLMTEQAGIIGDDFSMNICKQWEATFFQLTAPAIRQVALRTSIVLGNSGGAFPAMKRITRLGLGGYQGRGQQYISWVTDVDFCRAVEFIIQNEKLRGAVNLTAPYPVRNKDFMRLLRQKLKMPFGLPQPVSLLEIGACLVGTETELLLKSRYVYPERLIQEGFTFLTPQIEAALSKLCK